MTSPGRTPDAARVRSRYVVWDSKTGRVYLELPQAKNRRQALRELAALLNPYPHGSEWRERLTVPH